MLFEDNPRVDFPVSDFKSRCHCGSCLLSSLFLVTSIPVCRRLPEVINTSMHILKQVFLETWSESCAATWTFCPLQILLLSLYIFNNHVACQQWHFEKVIFLVKLEDGLEFHWRAPWAAGSLFMELSCILYYLWSLFRILTNNIFKVALCSRAKKRSQNALYI